MYVIALTVLSIGLVMPNATAQTPPDTAPAASPQSQPASIQASPPKNDPPQNDPQETDPVLTDPEKAKPESETPSPTTPTQPDVLPDETAGNETDAETDPAETNPAETNTAETNTADTTATGEKTSATAVSGPSTYGLWAIAPAIVAILLAIFTRQVVPALVVGLLVGAYMMAPYLSIDRIGDSGGEALKGFRLAFEYYLLKAVYDPGDDGQYGRLKIIVFTLVIGFMVGVIGRNGGTAGLVRWVTGNSDSPRRGTLTAWLAGMVVFFDDYANTMIVGPTMRPIFDKLRISRAKLAYIIDSTAAPVASIALIGTWVGAELGYIAEGIEAVKSGGQEAHLMDAGGGTYTAMDLFIRSLPYRFYPILALFMVFIVALFRRDFGPMRRAESEALDGVEAELVDDSPDDTVAPPRLMLGLLPILCLVFVTVGVLIASGLAQIDGWEATADKGELWERASYVIRNADAYLCIFYGAVSSAILAVLLSMTARSCSVRDAVDAGLEGMGRMFPAIVILVLATAIQSVESDLMLAEAAGDFLRDTGFSANYMPLAIFLASAVISFAMGSSWATMGLLCPLAVSVTVGLIANADMDAEAARVLLFSAVGSVLAGSIFGDHCSPISDTTVLSSIAAGCRHEEHVWTQLPYAIVTALAAVGAGEITCGIYGQPWYIGLASGAGALFLFLLIFGRSPQTPKGRERRTLVTDSVRSQVIAARMARSAPPQPPEPDDGEEYYQE